MAGRLARLAAAPAAIALAAGLAPGVTSAAPTVPPQPIPAHVYSPYFEAWTTDTLTDLATRSGVRYFTIAFLESTSKTSCTLAWNGSKTDAIPTTTRYVSDIASLRQLGGDVIPSSGGWSADQGGTEIADSCTSVSSIVSAYQALINEYKITRIDQDIEGRSLTKSDGISRRNQAMAQLQAANPTLTISYTIPTGATGLDASGKAVIADAESKGVRNFIIQPMVFDYYDRTTTDMGAAAIAVAKSTKAYLQSLEPGLTDSAAWSRVGLTIMNGIDDYPKRTEVTTLAHTTAISTFATAANSHLGVLSMWAIQRDNGGCPGVGGANNCSGVAQSDWDFSHILEPFTSTAP
jgi:hypothetical protein